MKQTVYWVLLLALGLRLGAALSVHTYLKSAGRQFLIEGDAAGYWELGQKLASGDEYSLYTPPRRAMRMPGYPLFLAASIRVAGNELWPARILQAGVGTFACWLVFRLGTVLINSRTGLLAAALAAISPTFVGFTPLILSETLFAATLLISLLLMARLSSGWPGSSDARDRADSAQQLPKRKLRLAFATGVAVGIACYVRPSWLLTAPLFCLIHLLMTSVARNHNLTVRTSTAIVSSAMECVFVIVGLAVALAPWTIRNFRVIGHAIPTTLWVGPSLYDGLHPGATGDSDMQFFEEDNLLATMSEYEMDREYRRRAWQFVRENPVRAFELSLIKIARLWKPWPNADQFRQWWLCLIVAGFSVPTILLAVREAIRRRFDIRCLLLTAGPVIYFTLIHAVFVGSIRYRLPAEYPLLILSGAGLLSACPWLLRRLPDSPSEPCSGGIS